MHFSSKSSKKAQRMLILSMIIFGTIGLFVRNIPLSSGEIALYRAILASLMLLIYLKITKQKITFSEIKSELPFLLLSGIAMGFNWICLFEAYRYTTVSVATLSYYFSPVIVMTASLILFKEKITMKQWICFLLSSLGIVLITGTGDMSTGSNHLLGILYGLGAAFLYALVVLLNKFMKKTTGIQRALLQFFAAIPVLLPYVYFTKGFSFASLNGIGLGCLLIIGLLHTGVTYCMYFSSIKELPGQQVAILSYIDPLVAVLISLLILKESMTPLQLLGGALILGFTLLNEIRATR